MKLKILFVTSFVGIKLTMAHSPFHQSSSRFPHNIKVIEDEEQAEQRRYLRHRYLGSVIREEYTADVLLKWEAEAPISSTNIGKLTDSAQTYITRNIPGSLPDVTTSNMALGILSVSAEQTLNVGLSPRILSVLLHVDGLVITDDDSFHSDSFNFSGIVESAIHANDDEFLRLSEPLVVMPVAHGVDPETNSNTAVTQALITLAVIGFALLILVLIWVYLKRKGDKPIHPSGGEKEERESGAKRGNRKNGDMPPEESSVDENSIYTLREAAPPSSKSNSSSAVQQPSEEENGGYLYNSFLGWSFSMSDDGSSGCEFDTTEAADNPPPRPKKRYTIENVDDISIGGDVDVFEDTSSHHDERERSRHRESHRSSYPSPMEHFEPETETEEEDDSSVEDIQTFDGSGRLGIEDLEDFDDYVSNLPAPYQHRSRKRRMDTRRSRRVLV